MTPETRDEDRGVTPDGTQRLMRFITAVRPHQPFDTDIVAAWTHKLNEHGINDRDAMTAANQLADNDDGRDIPIGAVIHTAKAIRNRRHLERQTATRPGTPTLGTGRAAWGDLTAAERGQWVGKAHAHWQSTAPSFTFDRDGHMVQGLARHLASGGSLEPPKPTPAGRCPCGGQLMLDDRATMTAKCDRCLCDFTLEAAR